MRTRRLTGRSGTTLDSDPYTIRRPTLPADWTANDTDETVPSDLEIPAPGRTTPKLRLSASQFCDRLSVVTESPALLVEPDEGDYALDPINGIPALDAIDSATIGTIVHKLCELEPQRPVWPAIIRRLVEDPENLTEVAIDDIIEQTETGLRAVQQLESDTAVHSRHSELSVTMELETATVVGDIDHLSVTDDGYIITDFKTSTVDEATIGDRTEQFYLQLLAYAGALLQADLETDQIDIAVVYTDAGGTRSRTLSREDVTVLQVWANDTIERHSLR